MDFENLHGQTGRLNKKKCEWFVDNFSFYLHENVVLGRL